MIYPDLYSIICGVIGKGYLGCSQIVQPIILATGVLLYFYSPCTCTRSMRIPLTNPKMLPVHDVVEVSRVGLHAWACIDHIIGHIGYEVTNCHVQWKSTYPVWAKLSKNICEKDGVWLN